MEVAELEKLVGNRGLVAGYWPRSKTAVVEISELSSVPRLVEDLTKIGARIVHVYGIDLGAGGLLVNYYLALDDGRRGHVLLRARLSRRNPKAPSVASACSAALWSEREWRELLGIEFEGHPDPRHLFLPQEWPEEDTLEKLLKAPMPRSRGSLVAIGPHHPALLEGLLIRVGVEGDEIVCVDIKPGFSHRGIMKLAESRNYWQDIFLVERVCGICSMAHTTCYVNAVERLAGIEPPPRARVIRTLVAELNRIHSHLLAAGVEAELAGQHSLFLRSWKIREYAMDAIEIATGNRASEAVNTIGGVRRDLSESKATAIRQKLEKLEEEFPELKKAFEDHRELRSKLEDVGKIPQHVARKWCIVGPSLRGSGIAEDVRKDSPYEYYDQVSWEVVADSGCDCLSRTLVRLEEVEQSLEICKQCLDSLKRAEGPVVEENVAIGPGEETMRVEAPRGELFYHVVSDGSPRPVSVVIRTPTYLNLPVLYDALLGHTLSDLPVIVGSLDPCISCLDRVVAVDAKSGRVAFEGRLAELGRRCR